MGTHYRQLSIEERCELARLHTGGAVNSGKLLQLWIAAQSTIVRGRSEMVSIRRATKSPPGVGARWVGILERLLLAQDRAGSTSIRLVAGATGTWLTGCRWTGSSEDEAYIERTGGEKDYVVGAPYLPEARRDGEPSAQWAQSGLLHCQAPSRRIAPGGGPTAKAARPLGGT